MKPHFMFVLLALSVLPSGSCITRPSPLTTRPTAHVGASPAAAFTETVPGSAVTFLMRPVPLGDAATLWVAETEVTWDAYDVFLNRLDLPADRRASAEADPG